MNPTDLPSVLCVDDEARVLDGLSLHLRRHYQVHTAQSGAQALAKLKELRGVAVVVSDMRMPGMDGATLLRQVMTLYPDTARILLTGEPGRDVAISAINEGQIFRFLTKPCPPEKLKEAIDAGVQQHRLASAERVLLQETLLGCIRALVDVLATTNPVAFGRAGRIKRLAMEFAGDLGYRAFWQLEAAAMLSQLGYVSLPVELVEKMYYAEKLTDEEKTLASAVPQVARKLLGHIPRMDAVLEIIERAAHGERIEAVGAESVLSVGSAILALVLEYDALITQGASVDAAIGTLRAQRRHDEELLAKFAHRVGASGTGGEEVRELPLRLVQPGMIFMEDLRTDLGTLLVARGFEVTESFVERVRNFGPGLLGEKVRVLVRHGARATPAVPA